MAYSDNPITLERMLPFLQPLAEGAGEVTWRCPPGTAQRFAYKVREALRIARALGAPEGLTRRIRVRVISFAYVHAVLEEYDAPQIAATPVQVHARADRPATTTPRELRTHVDSRLLHPTDWLSTISMQWLVTIQGGENKLHLPKAHLSEEQLRELYDWTSEEGLIFFEDEGSLTLMQRLGNEGAAAYAWSPEE